MVKLVIISCALLVACDAQFLFPGLSDLTSGRGSATTGASALQQTGAQGVSAVTSLIGLGSQISNPVDAISNQIQAGAPVIENSASSGTGVFQNIVSSATAGTSSFSAVPGLGEAATSLGGIAQQAQSGASILEGSVNSAKNTLENSASIFQNTVSGLLGNWQGQVTGLESTTDSNTMSQCLSSNMDFGKRVQEVSSQATNCLTSAMSALTSDYITISSKISAFNSKTSNLEKEERDCGTHWTAFACKLAVYVRLGTSTFTEWASLFDQMKTLSNVQNAGDVCGLAKTYEQLENESKTSFQNIEKCIADAFPAQTTSG